MNRKYNPKIHPLFLLIGTLGCKQTEVIGDGFVKAGKSLRNSNSNICSGIDDLQVCNSMVSCRIVQVGNVSKCDTK